MYVSLHGRRFGFDENGLLFDGRRVGGLPQAYGKGKTWYVNSVINGGDGSSPDSALGTIVAATAKCVANQGDVVLVLPGHAESVAASTVLTAIAGIRIIGLGRGADRPTITFTTANTAKYTCAVNSVHIENIIFVGNFLSIATCFLLTTAADFSVENCEFRDTLSTTGFLSILTTTVAVNSDGLRFVGNKRISLATTTPGPDLVIANTLDRLTVTDNTSFHTTISNNIAALIEHGALVVSDALVAYNDVYSANTDSSGGALLIKTTATTGGGIVKSNRVSSLDTAGVILVTVAAVQYAMFDNLASDRGTFTSGYLLPAIGAD